MSTRHVTAALLPGSLPFASPPGTCMAPCFGAPFALRVFQPEDDCVGRLVRFTGHLTETFCNRNLIATCIRSLDRGLYNSNIVIENVVDYGERIGNPRDTTSGNCYSLKLGDNHGAVSNYVSFRPEGFMDVLTSTDLTLTNITASYDSSFLHDSYPIIRFPLAPYHELTFTNVKFQDKADSTDNDPTWGTWGDANPNIVFCATEVKLHKWTGTNPPGYSPTIRGTRPYFAGTGTSVDIQYSSQ